MRTLYDLLGARPDDDAEGLRNAFRKAAKANHPDLHAGDPDASMRFRQIVEAYDILRDGQQRATYDRLLKFEREQFRWKLKRTVSYLMHGIVSDAIAVVGLAIVLGGGYTLFAYISKTPIDAAKPVEVAARGATKIAAVQPAAPTDTTAPDKVRSKSERVAAPEMPVVLGAVVPTANDGGAPAVTKGRPLPSSVGLNTEVAKPGNALYVPIRQADAKSADDDPEGNYGTGSLDQDKAQTVEVRLSSPEKGNGIAKLFPSHFAMSDDKNDMKIPDTPNMNMGNMKIPEIKMPAQTRTAPKRQATPRASFAQASLEHRNTSTCPGSQSCSGDAPPLFGVGF
jgi:curved DNA-binding protein CbpA